jgi:hypothetical protein
MKTLYTRFVLFLIGPAIRVELNEQQRPGGLRDESTRPGGTVLNEHQVVANAVLQSNQSTVSKGFNIEAAHMGGLSTTTFEASELPFAN